MKIFYTRKVNYTIKFSERKNQILKAIRGIGFDEIAEAIEKNQVIKNTKHFNKKKYPHQFLFLIKIENYVYLVPYVKNESKKEIYLKRLYPSRKFTKIYNNKISREELI